MLAGQQGPCSYLVKKGVEIMHSVEHKLAAGMLRLAVAAQIKNSDNGSFLLGEITE